MRLTKTLAAHGLSGDTIQRASVNRRPVDDGFLGFANIGGLGNKTDGKPGSTGSFGVRWSPPAKTKIGCNAFGLSCINSPWVNERLVCFSDSIFDFSVATLSRSSGVMHSLALFSSIFSGCRAMTALTIVAIISLDRWMDSSMRLLCCPMDCCSSIKSIGTLSAC